MTIFFYIIINIIIENWKEIRSHTNAVARSG